MVIWRVLQPTPEPFPMADMEGPSVKSGSRCLAWAEGRGRPRFASTVNPPDTRRLAPRPERQEFGFVGSWLDLRHVGLGAVAGPGHIVSASVLLPCLGQPPCSASAIRSSSMTAQAARRPASISTPLSCMSAHTNPASSLATATAAI